MKGEKVQVLLQVNAPNTGEFSGRLRAVEVGALALEHVSGEGVPCAWVNNGQCLQVGAHDYRVMQRQHQAGNWCWDFGTMYAEDLARLVNHLVRNGGWRSSDGPAHVASKVNNSRPVFADELAAIA